MLMRYFQKQPGERVVGITSCHLTDLQTDAVCNHCRRELPKGTKVVGNIVEVRKGRLVGARFSPTCFVCADIN